MFPMKTNIKTIPLLILLIIGQYFCSSQTTDTTSSSEVTNGIIGTVQLDGTPVESTMVVLLNTDDWKNDILNNTLMLDTVFTDSNGSFDFGEVDSGKYTVMIGDTINAAIFRNINPTKNGNLSDISLNATSSLKGKISAERGIIEKIYIKDTYFNTSPDSIKNFEFKAVPADSTTLYTLITDNESSLNYTAGHDLPPAAEVDKDHLQAVIDGFLLDNFDDGDSISNLDWFSKLGKWYAYTDADNGGNSLIEPASAVDNVTTCYTTTDSYDGNSLQVKFILGNALAGPYASVACRLGVPDKEYVGLEDMTQLAFMIKGSGTMRVNFITEYVDLNHSGIHRGDFGKTITGTDTWTEYRIGISELLPEPGTKIESDGITWQDVNSSVRALVFGSWANAGDTINLAIDNIRLYGIDPETYGQ